MNSQGIWYYRGDYESGSPPATPNAIKLRADVLKSPLEGGRGVFPPRRDFSGAAPTDAYTPVRLNSRRSLRPSRGRAVNFSSFSAAGRRADIIPLPSGERAG